MKNKQEYFYCLIGLLVIVGIFIILEQFSVSKVEDATYEKLELQMLLKKAVLDEHFESISSELKSASNTQMMKESIATLTSTWNQLQTSEQTKIQRLFQTEKSALKVKQAFIKEAQAADSNAHEKVNQINAQNHSYLSMLNSYSMYDTSQHLRTMISPELQEYLDVQAKFEEYGHQFMSHFNYYDVFLVSRGGDIVYTHAVEDDYGTNLVDGFYDNTELAKVFDEVMHQASPQVVYSAFEPYAPSKNLPSMFAAYPIMQEGEIIGVIALQLTTASLTSIMKPVQNSGRTVDYYLVNSTYELINQSRFSQTTEMQTIVNTPNITAGLSGKSGRIKQKNYNETEVLSAYKPYRYKNLTWVMAADQSVEEVHKPVQLWWMYATIIASIIYLTLYWLTRYLLLKKGITRPNNVLLSKNYV